VVIYTQQKTRHGLTITGVLAVFTFLLNFLEERSVEGGGNRIGEGTIAMGTSHNECASVFHVRGCFCGLFVRAVETNHMSIKAHNVGLNAVHGVL